MMLLLHAGPHGNYLCSRRVTGFGRLGSFLAPRQHDFIPALSPATHNAGLRFSWRVAAGTEANILPFFGRWRRRIADSDAVLYRCPNTGQTVQNSSEESASNDMF